MATADRSSRIFISYRREDSLGHVLALVRALRQHFGAGRIFKDTDNIPPGQDFLQFIKRELESCSVVLAIIGRDWLTVQDPRLGRPRLHNADDFLRVEVGTALADGRIRVIPVLVDGATMPSAEDLPPDLASLAHRNAVELSDARWETDVQRLIEAIEDAGPTSAPPPSPDAARRPELYDLRRSSGREISEHLAAARQAFAAQDFDAAVSACERALLLDPQAAEALALLDRAYKAIDERKIEVWLAEADEALNRGEVADASDLIDRALAIEITSAAALALRQKMLNIRREREHRRERARVVSLAVERARASLDAGNFDAACRQAAEALTIEPTSAEAAAIHARALAALEDQRRRREHAAQLVAEARRAFAAGEHEAALRLLHSYGPPDKQVSDALEELQAERDSCEQRMRRMQENDARARMEAARREQERAAAEAARRERAQEERGKAVPPVLLGVSAPRHVGVGASFIARFVAYVEEVQAVVRQQLRDLDEPTPGGVQTALGLTPSRGGRWREGTPVTVRVTGTDLTAQPSSQSFEWNGRHNLVSFVLTLAPESAAKDVQVCFEAFIEGISVAFVPLNVRVGSAAGSSAPAILTARPASSAFASYASPDAPLVALCLSALKHWDPQLDIFMDCLDLTPNDPWQRELERVIPARDAFLLFWSVNAMRSKWVAWELHTATAKKGLDCVRPMPIDDPAIAPPPEVLKHLNFRDRYLLARQGFLKLAKRQ